MSHRFVRIVPASLSAAGVLLAAAPAFAASWQTNVQYGGNMSTDYYVPDAPADPAPIVVSIHFCGGTKGNAQGWFRSDADRLGFIIITPQAGGNCFDAGIGKSGERAEIVQMVDYAVSEFGGDPDHAYAAGASSGACMAQALAASYPEVFAAASSLAGTPAGSWTGGNAYGWSTPALTPEEWGDKVRDLNPTYMGPWPRMQIWHGSGDTNLSYDQNFPVEKSQWVNVWGLSEADGVESSVQFNNSWERTTWADSNGIIGVEANSAGLPHDLTGSGLWGDVVRFMIEDEPADRGGPTGTAGAGGEAAGGASPVGGGTSESGAGGADVGVGGAAQAGMGMGMGMMPGMAGSAGMVAMAGGASMGMGGASMGPVMGSAGTTASAGTSPTGMPTGVAAPAGAAGSMSAANAGAPAGAAAGSGAVVMASDVAPAKGCSVGTSPRGKSFFPLAALSLLGAFGLAFRRRRFAAGH